MIYTSSISFPNIFSPVSGKTKIDTTFNAINKRLSLLIQTAYMELFGNPEFGCGIYETMFDYANNATFDILRRKIFDSIKKFENTIIVSEDTININFNPLNNHVEIHIGYTIKDTSIKGETSLEMNTDI